MKEELKNFMQKNESIYWYGMDYERMSQLIDEFFEQYQPERTSEKDVEYFGMKAEFKDGLCYLENGKNNRPIPRNRRMRCSDLSNERERD